VCVLIAVGTDVTVSCDMDCEVNILNGERD
jgi:hypothetical protein